ncbi:MAG: sugar transferase [Bacteroidota bacterium]|nr:sugar transferase [Rhodothermia bacterium]MDW8284993.1 sugar transferase [Bacteroidota bacterium]
MKYKRIFDISIILLTHILLFPIFLFMWIVIPLLILLVDGRPVFYRQKRIGKDGRIFYILKFRTMISDQKNPHQIKWTLPNDSRITKIGRILRKTALDELPQVWNIIKGDMSLVGPRALSEEEHIFWLERIPEYKERLKILPGLTGLSQIYNRNDDPYLKVKFDIEYINNMNLLMDIKIIFISIINTLTANWDNRNGKTIRDLGDFI